ncbi:MAG TPA: metallophosphoesterase [Actinomycetota bacterium]|nr:metallophosphoesterase [Actinomycetota bacterium]
MRGHHLTIAQISDLHCGHPMFDGELLDHAIDEILDLEPNLVAVVGDLTSEGYGPQFRQAKRYLDRLSDLEMLVIPGNHDLMNVGFLHFRDAFGKSDRVVRLPMTPGGRREDGSGEPQRWATVVAVNSSKPDLAEGEVGHIRYDWIRASYEWPDDYRIFVLHHHLVSVPGTGRERNIVWDAGDVLALLTELDVSLVLAGHKHVPNVWQFGEMLLVNSGTASSHRVRGYTRPSYNVIEIDEEKVRIVQRYPGVGEAVAATYSHAERRLKLNPQLEGMFNRGAWNV